MNTVEILKRAKARIENPEHWCTGSLARNTLGGVTAPRSSDACKWCAFGAIIAEANHGTFQVEQALDIVAIPIINSMGRAGPEVKNLRGAAYVNDYTDHATVMRMYDLAIAEAEKDLAPTESE